MITQVVIVKAKHPTWSERYKLGVELSKSLDPVRTFEEVGAELGITKQNAYTETVLALGTLGWRLREFDRIVMEMCRACTITGVAS